MLRIIDKETSLFIRDDFTFNPDAEVGLDVTPAQGLYKPKWNGTEWIEGLTQKEIDEIKANVIVEPSIEERLQALELMELERILGGYVE